MLRLFMTPARLLEELNMPTTTARGRDSALKAVRLIASMEAVFRSSNPERRAHIGRVGVPLWQLEQRETRKMLVKAGAAARFSELAAATKDGGKAVDAELRMWATAALGMVRGRGYAWHCRPQIGCRRVVSGISMGERRS